MNEFFKNLPLNTQKLYAQVEDKSGCKIFIPLSKESDADLVKQKMKTFLFYQPNPPRDPKRYA